MVAVREGQDLGPAGHEPGQPDRPAVRVGRGQRVRPQRQAEATGQLGGHPLGVLGGQHGGDATGRTDPLGDRGHGRRGGVPGHRGGVAEREVDVGVAVDVGDPVAAGAGLVEREPAGPLVHPGHRDPAEKMVGAVEELARAGVAQLMGLALAGEQVTGTASVDGGHGASKPCQGRRLVAERDVRWTVP